MLAYSNILEVHVTVPVSAVHSLRFDSSFMSVMDLSITYCQQLRPEAEVRTRGGRIVSIDVGSSACCSLS